MQGLVEDLAHAHNEALSLLGADIVMAASHVHVDCKRGGGLLDAHCKGIAAFCVRYFATVCFASYTK